MQFLSYTLSHRPLAQAALLTALAFTISASPGRTETVSIDVEPGALGNIVADGQMNLLDLLRMRDVVNDYGAPPTDSEIRAGDIDQDGALTGNDLAMLEQTLLRRLPVRYLVLGDGGIVVGNDGRTRYMIPVGAYDSPKVMSVGDFSKEDFEETYDLDIESLGTDVRYLAGAVLTIHNPEPGDEVMPVGVELWEQADSIDATGNNGVFNIAPDADGSGAADFRFLGDLRSDDSGTALVFAVESEIEIKTVERVVFDIGLEQDVVVPVAHFETGMTLRARGTGWQGNQFSDYVVEWHAADGDTLRAPILRFSPIGAYSVTDIDGVVFTVPPASASPWVALRVVCLPSGGATAPLGIESREPDPLVMEGLRDSLLAVYQGMDALLVELGTVQNTERIFELNGYSFDVFLQEFRNAVQEFESVDEEDLDPIGMGVTWAAMMNAQIPEFLREARWRAQLEEDHRREGPPDPNPECIQRCRLTYSFLDAVLRTGSVLGWAGCTSACCAAAPHLCPICALACAGSTVLLNVIIDALDDGYRICLQECCPPDYGITCDVFATPQAETLDFVQVCIHFSWHALIVEPYGCWQCGSGCETYRTRVLTSCTGDFPRECSPEQQGRAPESTRNHLGLIVRVQDSPVPLSEATVGANGIGYMPFNVMSGSIRMTAFDPATGFFDDDAGDVYVADPFGEVHVVPISFRPDTTTVRVPLAIGQWLAGEVTVGQPNFQFLIDVSEEEVGSVVNWGVWAGTTLSMSVSEPDGDIIANNNGDSDCLNVRGIMLGEPGTYVIRVGRGASGQVGEFAAGANWSPYPATPYLCGQVEGTLYAEWSPYRVASRGVVEEGTTVIIEGGTVIDWYDRGELDIRGEVSSFGDGGVQLRRASTIDAEMAPAAGHGHATFAR